MSPSLCLLHGLIALLLAHVAWGQGDSSLYISEFMADNGGSLEDEDEDTPDWIELHNRGVETIDLTGFQLTDDPDVPNKWVFPFVAIEPDSRLLVFASGKDRRDPSSPLHTNFSLDANGEYLALTSPGGELLSVWDTYPSQAEDESYGLSGEERAETLIDTKSACRWNVPFSSIMDLRWTLPAFDDSRWFAGVSGLGYDFGTDYQEWLFTDTQFEMAGFATSLQARFRVDLPEVSSVVGLRLFLRFDDGFVAFLNGERVGAAAAPEPLLSDSRATSDREPSDAIQEMVLDLTERRGLLVEGENVFAFQGLDASPTTGDFLLSPRLEIQRRIDPLTYGIMVEPTPGEANSESFEGRVAEVQFDVQARFHEEEFLLRMSTGTLGADIYYTFDGTPPSQLDGILYEGPVTIDETFAVRARAFKTGLIATSVTTRTYVFPQELAAQSVMNQSVVNPDRVEVERQFQESLPIVSIAVDPLLMFGPGGLDTAPDQDRDVSASIEYFTGTNPEEGFQVNAGLGIHGGNARSHPKKPFRLFFRREYGAARLEFPLFEDSPVSSFDQLILRAGGHDSWSISLGFGSTSQSLPFHASYLRDQFLRKTEIDMGRLSPRGRYVQLILNGFFWGVYDLHERPNADFFADHLGGMKKDWDVLHHADTFDLDWSVIDGDDAHWQGIHERLEEGIDSVETLGNLQTEIDLDELIDMLIVRFWSGDYDWAGPIFWMDQEVTGFRNKNWYAGQRRGDTPGPYRFFTWDAEMSMGAHLLDNVFGFGVDQRVVDFDLTEANDPGTPAAFHQALRHIPAYRLRFADRVQKHFYQEGVLTTEAAQARLDELASQLDPLMIAESARWGDLHQFNPNFTRDSHWRPEVTWLRESFIPERRNELLRQLRERGLLAEVEAPSMRPFGGSLDGVASIRLTADEGTIYVTTDGSDPAGQMNFQRSLLVNASSEGHFLIPSEANGGAALEASWKEVAEPANFDAWTLGSASIGYDVSASDDFGPHFTTDVEEMSGNNATVYLRVSFELENPEDVETIVLRAKFDDGFAAFLNGQPIAASTPPDVLAWNSESTAIHSDEDAVFFRDFDVTATAKDVLVPGGNLLAVQGLNTSPTSSDFLFSPELIVVMTEGAALPSASSQVLSGDLVLTEATTVKARARSSSGVWSALSEAHFFPGQAPERAGLLLSEIHYHPLSTDTRPSTDFEFIEVLNTTDTAIQLSGLRFSEGIEFEFGEGLIEGGQRLLIVSNREAFVERYGEGVGAAVIGEYSGSRLSNGGEMVSLVDGMGQVIDQVTYEDGAPWPTAADGGGGSLVRLEGATSGPSAWAVSQEVGGSPGALGDIYNYEAWRARFFANVLGPEGEPLADPDNDQQVNLLEYFSNTDPTEDNEPPFFELTHDEDHFTLAYRQSVDVADVDVTIEGSSDLQSWAAVEGVEREGVAINEAFLEIRQAFPVSESRWYRLLLELRSLP